MTAQSLIEAEVETKRVTRGAQDVQAEIDALEREWDKADDQPNLAWKKPGIMKQIQKKRRWLGLYQANQGAVTEAHSRRQFIKMLTGAFASAAVPVPTFTPRHPFATAIDAAVKSLSPAGSVSMLGKIMNSGVLALLSDGGRNRDVEKSILRAGKTHPMAGAMMAYHYSKSVLRAPWPAAEHMIRGTRLASLYAQQHDLASFTQIARKSKPRSNNKTPDWVQDKKTKTAQSGTERPASASQAVGNQARHVSHYARESRKPS